MLLGLVLPPEPTRIALSGLIGPDQLLYGTALEYLESVLPERLREPLFARLVPGGSAAPARLHVVELDDVAERAA
jgi:hypothetical protein